MKELDGETLDTLSLSLSIIFDINSTFLKQLIECLPIGMSDDEVYNEITKYAKNTKYDVIYAFHLTRCSANAINNIRKNGLLCANDIINFVFEDIYSFFKKKIERTDYYKTVKAIKNNINKIPRNPLNDPDICGLMLKRNFANKHFLKKYDGPELIHDLLIELSKKYDFIFEYYEYLRPYVIKVKIYDRYSVKYIKNALFHLYLSLHNQNDKYDYTITFTNCKIVYIEELEDLYE